MASIKEANCSASLANGLLTLENGRMIDLGLIEDLLSSIADAHVQNSKGGEHDLQLSSRAAAGKAREVLTALDSSPINKPMLKVSSSVVVVSDEVPQAATAQEHERYLTLIDQRDALAVDLAGDLNDPVKQAACANWDMSAAGVELAALMQRFRNLHD